MATQANPEFVEALCGAWVRGWYAGIDGIKNDDGKRSAAAEIAADSRFASLNAAPDLLAALGKCHAHLFTCADRDGALCQEVEAALAKAGE